MAAARKGACLSAPAAAWAALAHGTLGMGWVSALAYIALISAGAFGIGYEIADGGIAAALFLIMAGVGVVVVGVSSSLLFATAPALIAAPSAHAGGSLRERRSHPCITGKEAVET
jgi:hypothetical protein